MTNDKLEKLLAIRRQVCNLTTDQIPARDFEGPLQWLMEYFSSCRASQKVVGDQYWNGVRKDILGAIKVEIKRLNDEFASL